MNIIRIEGKGILPVQVMRAKGGNYVGVCEPFALTIQSETWAKLMDDFANTLNLLFADLLEDGELQEFLHERGFRITSSLPQQPVDIWFDVPFSPTLAANRDSAPTLH